MSKHTLESVAKEIVSRINRKYDGDIFYFTRSEIKFLFSNGKRIIKNKQQSEQLALRIIKENSIGYACSSGTYDPLQIIEDALYTSNYNREKINCIRSSSIADVREVCVFDDKLLDIDFGSIKKIQNYLSKVSKDSKFTCQIYIVIDDITYMSFNHSKDTEEKSYKKSVLKVEFEAVDRNGEKRLHYKKASCKLFDFVADISQQMHKRENLKTLKYQVPNNVKLLFSPLAEYCIIKNYLGFLLNEKLSMHKDIVVDIGNNVCVYDDGIVNWQTGSRPFDDEGIECGRNCLIDNGRIIKRYTDLITAQRNQSESTGNGSRGWGSPPFPEANNLVIGFNKEKVKIESTDTVLLIDYVEDDGTSDSVNGYFHGDCKIGIVHHGNSAIGLVGAFHLDIDIKRFMKYATPYDDGEWVAGNFFIPAAFVSSYSKISDKERIVINDD